MRAFIWQGVSLTLELSFPTDPRLLRVVRAVVGQMAGLCGFQEDEIQFITLAVDEACANIIRHAYGGRRDGEIRLSCSVKDEGIEFLLIDRGSAPKDVHRLEPRSVDEVRPGGLGMHLIRSVMDEVRYRFGERENQLYLTKRLHSGRRVQGGAILE
jgi:anti-sigma regulatory factor (Ser/Thr protein kinase)